MKFDYNPFENDPDREHSKLLSDYMKKFGSSGSYKAESTYIEKKRNEKFTSEDIKKKIELDKNFTKEGLYETDKSNKKRKETELKNANSKKFFARFWKPKWRSVPTDGTRGYDDWKDK